MGFKEDANASFNQGTKWYKKRSVMERYLLISSIILFVAFISAIGIIIHRNLQEKNNRVCLTPGCIQASAVALKYMDQKVDPCENFYNFACGGYLKETFIPEEKSSVGQFNIISEKIDERLRMLVEDVPDDAIKPFHLIKQVYDICMNVTQIELDGLSYAKDYLEKLGGWPLLEGSRWNEKDFDWQQFTYKAEQNAFYISYFIYCGVGVDIKNSTKRVIWIDEGSIPLSREFLIKGLNETLVQNYYDYIVDIAVLYGADKNKATKELKEYLDLAIEFAKLLLPRESRRNSTALYNPMTIKELSVKYPFVNWLEYITKVTNVPDIEITEEEVVIVAVPDFLNKLDNFLKKTPKRLLGNYAMTRIATSMVYYLPERFRKRMEELSKKNRGNKQATPRWKECLGSAVSLGSLATSATYVRKYFNKSSKRRIEEMIDDIQGEFVRMLQENDWMDDTTKKQALAKAEAITKYIGYPEELLDDELVEDYYKNLTISSKNLLTSMKSVSAYYKNYYNNKLRLPFNKTEWLRHSGATTVNAFYSSIENSIEFPAGILQGVFFDENRPQYMNYGAIGHIIGHEITHGFDDRGRQYDKNGNLRDWWDQETKQAFIKKAQCIIDQYGNYTVPEVDLNLNGINTQGENIADNGGIKEAYLAYENWVRRYGEEPKLPGLNYTPRQMFWVSAAQVWCVKARKEIVKIQVTTGAHSVAEFRVIGPFGNSEYFSRDFKCPPGAPMNPGKKCKVW